MSRPKNGMRVRSRVQGAPAAAPRAAIERQPGAPELDLDVLLNLATLVDMAKAGKLVGFVTIGVGPGGEAVSAAGGKLDLSTALLAFEIWKHQQVSAKVEQGSEERTER